jgi:hypothetical protein
VLVPADAVSALAAASRAGFASCAAAPANALGADADAAEICPTTVIGGPRAIASAKTDDTTIEGLLVAAAALVSAARAEASAVASDIETPVGAIGSSAGLAEAGSPTVAVLAATGSTPADGARPAGPDAVGTRGVGATPLTVWITGLTTPSSETIGATILVTAAATGAPTSVTPERTGATTSPVVLRTGAAVLVIV